MSDAADHLRFWRDHRWAPGQMSAYIDDELRPRQRARLNRHAEECTACRGVLAELTTLVRRLGRLPSVGDGAGAVRIASGARLRIDETRGS